MRLPAIVSLTAVGLLIFAAAARARAQDGQPALGPMARPTFSPYLNLLRRGDPVLNYYGLVRPQLELRGSVQQLQQRLSGQLISEEERASALPATGHPSRFMHYSHYFLNMGTGNPSMARHRRPRH